MSYIDTGRHELCGTLANLPVYHPLEAYDKEFTADTTNLLLGGGSGEFPAAIADARMCAAVFLDEAADELLERIDNPDVYFWVWPDLVEVGYDAIAAAAETLAHGPVFDTSAPDPIDFSDWGGDSWAWVVDQAAKWGNNPYDVDKHHSIERWLATSLGEFIVISYPSLLGDVAPSTQHVLDKVRAGLSRSPLLANIWQLPTGYQTGGRGEMITDPLMRH